MKKRSAMLAGAAFSAAFLVILVMLELSRRESLPLRRNRIARVSIEDFFVGYHAIDEPSVVSVAVDRSRRFLSTLSRRERSNLVGYLSEIRFHEVSERKEDGVWIRLNSMSDTRNGVVVCAGEFHACTLSDWLAYLRSMVEPMAGKLLDRWQVRNGNAGEIFDAAAGLALVAPSTPGIAEYLTVALDSSNPQHAVYLPEHYTRAIHLLGHMGIHAVCAYELLETCAVTSKEPSIREAAREAMEAIAEDKAR